MPFSWKFGKVHVLAEALLVSWKSNKYHLLYRISSYTFAHSNSAAPVHFLHCYWLAELASTDFTEPQIGNFKRLLLGLATWHWMVKKAMCRTGTGFFLVNIAVPPLPEFLLHKFHLHAISQNWRRDTLEKKSILWIFQDLLVICANQTANGKMCSIEILLDDCCGLILGQVTVWPKIGN